MRILRGQSNREVSSKGFALFVAGLVLATFVGGVVRTLLSSDQVHARIVSELKNRFPNHEFEIGRIEVLLSRGLWPALGLRVHDVVFKQDVCGKLSFVLTLPRAALPLDLWALAKGAWRLKQVQIDGGEIHFDYRPCPGAERGPAPGGGGEKPHPNMVHKSVLAPKFNWQELKKSLDSVQLRDFTVTYEKTATWKLNLTSAYLNLGSQIEFNAKIDVAKSLPFGTLVHPLIFDLKGDPGDVHWAITSVYKEGQGQILGHVHDGHAEIRATLRQVPIKDFVGELFEMGFVERELKLKATWLTCQLAWNGPLENYIAEPVTAENCRVEGGYGHAELKQAKFWFDGSDFREPARVQIEDLQMQPFLEGLHREVLPAVISHPGKWNGYIELSRALEWRLEGVLRDAEIIFNNQNMHGKQIVDEVHTSVTSHDHQVKAVIDAAQLREGKCDCRLEADLSEDLRDGTFQVQIKEFSLSPAIQKLLIGGSFAILQGQGRGSLLNGELKQWTGNFSLSEMHGEGWRVQGMALASHYLDGVFSIEAKAQSGVAEKSWRLFPQLRVPAPEVTEQISFAAIEVKADIEKNGGHIQLLSARQGASRRQWKSFGSWVRDGEFTGSLVLTQARKASKYDVHGQKGRLLIDPVQAADE